jgi:hypothetical protein
MGVLQLFGNAIKNIILFRGEQLRRAHVVAMYILIVTNVVLSYSEYDNVKADRIFWQRRMLQQIVVAIMASVHVECEIMEQEEAQAIAVAADGQVPRTWLPPQLGCRAIIAIAAVAMVAFLWMTRGHQDEHTVTFEAFAFHQLHALVFAYVKWLNDRHIGIQ